MRSLLRLSRLLPAFAAGVALLFAGCASETPLRTNPDSYAPVKIGVILPLTGKNSRFGERLRNGIEVAAEELNHGRGIAGRPIELLYADTASDPMLAAEAARDLAQSGAVALVAGYDSEEVKALRGTVEALGLPTVAPLATDNELIAPGGRLLFRAAFTDAQQSRALAYYLWYWRKLMRLGVLTDSTSAYADGIARQTAREFSALGGVVTGYAEYREDMEDFTAPLRELLSYAPQAIVVPASPATSGKLVRQLRNLGFRGVIVGPDSWDENEFLDQCGPQPGDCAFIAFYSDDNRTAEQEVFREAFRKKFFFYPGSDEAQGYDSLQLLSIALANAKTVEEFQANLLLIRNHLGATGQFTMLPGGEIDRTLVLKTLRGAAPGHKRATTRFGKAFTTARLDQYNN